MQFLQVCDLKRHCIKEGIKCPISIQIGAQHQ